VREDVLGVVDAQSGAMLGMLTAVADETAHLATPSGSPVKSGSSPTRV
jgi:hypothetical protein